MGRGRRAGLSAPKFAPECDSGNRPLCYPKIKRVKIGKNSKVGLFLTHVVPGVARPMRVLWNEIIGFIFVVLGVVVTSGSIRAYRALKPEEITVWKIAVLAFLPVVLLYFGVTSFLRARRISRS
jgi:hypothetical protein